MVGNFDDFAEPTTVVWDFAGPSNRLLNSDEHMSQYALEYAGYSLQERTCDMVPRKEVSSAIPREWLFDIRMSEDPYSILPVSETVLGRLVGVGSFGNVYRTTISGHDIAIKSLNPYNAMEDARLAAMDLMALAGGKGVSVPRLYGTGFDRNSLHAVVVQEYIQGISLKEVLTSPEKRFSPNRKLEMMISVTEQVGQLNDAGIQHCDLKPSNVIMCPELSGDAPYVLSADRAVLLDFDLAKYVLPGKDIVDLTEDGVGVIYGTLSTMSPEVATKSAISRWSDQYSVGIVLYNMCTGEMPFQSKALWPMLFAKDSEHKFMHPLKEGYPEGLVPVVEKAMSRDPADRYGSCHELASELRNLLVLN